MVRLQIVGGGKMGEALAHGLLAARWAGADEVAIVERYEPRRLDLVKIFPGVAILDEPGPCEGAVIAVKPDDVNSACQSLGARGVTRVLSIAAGVTLGQLESALAPGTPVVRSMPNTPALLGAGASALAGGAEATEADLAWAESILGEVGVVVRVDEALLDVVTGLSGSGPAYVFLMAEALIEAGVLMGLPRDVASLLVGHTVLGSARMLLEHGDPPAELRAAVTSPGGTTAAGLRALEDAGVRAAFAAAVKAATNRSRQLGQS